MRRTADFGRGAAAGGDEPGNYDPLLKMRPMIALIQRVSRASVHIDGELAGALGAGVVGLGCAQRGDGGAGARVGAGLLALVCAQRGDGEREADGLLDRLLDYRVFADEAGRMNLGLRT